MADLKISQFTDGGAVQDTDEIATNRAGVNTKVFVGTMAAEDVADYTTTDNLADVALSGEAVDVSYDNSTSGLSATDVQGAIDELAASSTSIPYTDASASAPASLDFAEDTDNGTNKVTLKAPDSITSDADIVLPAAAGTLATLAGTETLTNKTIASPTLTGTPVAPTAVQYTDTTQLATTAFSNAAAALYAHISGFTPSSVTGTSTTGSLTVAAGQATDSANAALITKASTTSWAVSNGNAINGYEGGTTLPNSTTIHFYMCRGASGVGSFASSSLTPTVPAGYDSYYRRVFSIPTNSSGALLPGTAIIVEGGSMQYWLTSVVTDVNVVNLGTSRTTYTLASVPSGIRVRPLGRQSTSSANISVVSSLEEADVAPSDSTLPKAFDLGNAAGYTAATRLSSQITTNTSAQIAARGATTSMGFAVVTHGWIDFRRA